MNNSPQHIYRQYIDQFKNQLKKVKKTLVMLSLVRLIVFALIILSIFLLWGNYKMILISVLIGLILFFTLISKYTSFKAQKNKLKALIKINKTELKVLKRDFSDLPNGKNYKNPLHAFSQDIDLFGQKSFFQYLNRTALKGGEEKLAFLLTENNIESIEIKQNTIAELGKQINFRQNFSALAVLSSTHEEDTVQSIDKRLDLLKTHQFFTPKYAQLIANLFSVISIGVIIAYLTGWIAGMTLALWLVLGLLITSVYIKRVNVLSDKVSKMQSIFRQYHQLLECIESADFTSELLKDLQQKISTEHKKASEILKAFSKAIDALDQRNNLLFGFIGNGFLLWDMRQSSRLEKWLKTYISKVENWFEVIYTIDAYNSLGNFHFNHPNYNFPAITNNSTLIKAKEIVHPLIDPKEAVTNDLQIDKDNFFIITGANMAGKSTFLRTVSLQIIMSNIGLPICAKTCEYSPIKLITSMRTVDSLADDSSYFYAELTRLKFIIDQLKKDDYFIVLDEILKGTNSKDKAEGSQKFVEKLVGFKATGIIATHDLSLCAVSKELPQVKNYYFDAQIIDDELYFDYQFKRGICQNMNASFLLRKMKIVDD